ncbi:MAG: alkaline phosphatase family protein [archaeon]
MAARKSELLKMGIVVALLSLLVAAAVYFQFSGPKTSPVPSKVYWFVPDGLRAEPELFKLYEWAEAGELPNIKWMIENGAYGYSLPDFPSHTPVNFAALMTGAHPNVNGVSDGPMHVEGKPLDKPAVSGFSSVAKKVPPVWKTLEEQGKRVFLLSIPGSTPPELENGWTVRGRWSGWGADTPAINFESIEKLEEWKKYGRAFRLFYLGQPLTVFLGSTKKPAQVPSDLSESEDAPLLVNLSNYGTAIQAFLLSDSAGNYSSAEIYYDGKKVSDLHQGERTGWFSVNLSFSNMSFSSEAYVTLIKLEPDGKFRFRVFFNNVNKFLTDPLEVAEDLTRNVGPSVDFVDNWPNQLVFEQEDKEVFFAEAMESLDWHRRAAGYVIQKYSPDVFIQDTYTPNQFLEARWWHANVYNNTPKYGGPEAEAESWKAILEMYKGVDRILGEARKELPPNSMIILSSDHGIAFLQKEVKINSVFADKGWLFFKTNPTTGEPTIDWNRSRVIFLKMNHVYINPDGLGGNYKRASGPEYEALREEVSETLLSLKDEDGISPIVSVKLGPEDNSVYEQVVPFDRASEVFSLYPERVGDLVFEQRLGYQTIEEMDDGPVFVQSLSSGYKQAIDPNSTSLWTPFMIVGPGIKKGYFLEKPISHVDQMPTILHSMNLSIPNHVQGRVLSEIFIAG